MQDVCACGGDTVFAKLLWTFVSLVSLGPWDAWGLKARFNESPEPPVCVTGRVEVEDDSGNVVRPSPKRKHLTTSEQFLTTCPQQSSYTTSCDVLLIFGVLSSPFLHAEHLRIHSVPDIPWT